MKKSNTVILNIIGTITIISIFFYLIKGEFRVNTILSANGNNKTLINNFQTIDKENSELFKKIRDKNKTVSKKSKKDTHKVSKYIKLIDKKRFIDNLNSLEIKEGQTLNKNENDIVLNGIKHLINENLNKIPSDKKLSTNLIEQNITESNKTKEDNYYYPYVWAVEWPFKKEEDNSSLDDENDSILSDDGESIEDKIYNIGGEIGNKVLIRIFKKEKRLELWMDITGEYKFLKSYPIARYSGTLGAKRSLRDGQSPEGYYSINIHRIIKKDDLFTKMDLGFPNRYDKEHNVSSGYASIHNPSIQEDGFVMSNSNISEIYNLVQEALLNGYKTIPVYIYPFVMTQDNLARYYNSRWIEFWLNIKEGYDFFNRYHRTPKIEIRNGRYIFHIL